MNYSIFLFCVLLFTVTNVHAQQRIDIPAPRPQRDSLNAIPDSAVRRQHMLDTLNSRVRSFNRIYSSEPESADSLFSPFRVYPPACARTASVSLCRVLKNKPGFSGGFYSLSNSLNRLFDDQTALPLSFSSRVPAPVPSGPDPFMTTIHDVRVRSPHAPELEYYPRTEVTPHTDVLWENGLFSANVLSIRFARPLSRKLFGSVNSHYRFFPSEDYDHDRGDIYTFYRQFVGDTTLLLHGWHNPRAKEQQTDLSLRYLAPRSATIVCRYSYGDFENEVAVENRPASFGPAVVNWDRLNRYRNDLSFSMTGLRAGAFALNTMGDFHSSVGRYSPVQNDNSDRGTRLGYGLSSEIVWLPSARDTVVLELAGADANVARYDDSHQYQEKESIRLSYQAGRARFFPVSIHSRIGGGLNRVEQKNHGGTVHPSADVLVSVLYGKHRGTLSLHHEPLYAPLPFDSIPSPLAEADPFSRAYGSVYLDFRSFSLFCSGSLASDIDSTLRASYWLRGVPPHESRRRTLTLRASTGRFCGTALSAWATSADRRPYLKSGITLDWRTGLANNRGSLNTLIACEYWSTRAPVDFGGIDTWHREFYNLKLRADIRIKTFTLFYKADNLLNRKIVYFPGYYLPGLTFRWGFRWLIEG